MAVTPGRAAPSYICLICSSHVSNNKIPQQDHIPKCLLRSRRRQVCVFSPPHVLQCSTADSWHGRLQACRFRLLHQVVTLSQNRRSLVSPTEVHPLCVRRQCYCFANAWPPCSHLLLTPHSCFSHPVRHHAFFLQGSKEHRVGGRSTGLYPLLQGGTMACILLSGGSGLRCRLGCY